jgi:hypothetical protein
MLYIVKIKQESSKYMGRSKEFMKKKEKNEGRGRNLEKLQSPLLKNLKVLEETSPYHIECLNLRSGY